MPPVLAQYTIRSKQEYIYTSGRVREICGASALITGVWDEVFFPAAKAALGSGSFTRLPSDQEIQALEKQNDHRWAAFTLSTAFQGGVRLVELSRGGGALTVLYDSMEAYKAVNRRFTRAVLALRPGMVPMAAAVECGKGNDYRADYRKLGDISGAKKLVQTPGRDDFVLPYALMDRSTMQPIGVVRKEGKKAVQLSAESDCKREAGKKLTDKEVRELDDMVTEKGRESLLAIIHADGNNMGAKIPLVLGDHRTYDDCIPLMRRFTAAVENAFVTAGQLALNQCREDLEAKHKDKGFDKASFAVRMIINGGDDLTLLCNARFAREYAAAYLNAVQAVKPFELGKVKIEFNSCAGIAIFHSHYPVARAYEIAEQCCDNAKAKVHVTTEQCCDNAKGRVHVTTGTAPEESWLDWYFIRSGIGGSLKELRKRQGISDCIGRPWQVGGGDGYDLVRLDELHKLIGKGGRYPVARSNVKAIGTACEVGQTAAENELARVCRRMPALNTELKKRLDGTLYDYAEMFDLWYGERKGEKADEQKAHS